MKLFTDKTYSVLPLSEFKLFADIKTGFPGAESALGKAIIANAEDALQSEIPQLYASAYRRFVEDGDRQEYETAYFGRRTQLKKLLLGEIVQNENRFTDKIIDLLWLILEETSWIIPAHNFNASSTNDADATKMPLPYCYDCTVTFVDLFSAETGAILGLVYYYLKGKIESKVSYTVNDRIVYAIRQRVLTPFMRMENMWWMGTNGHSTNNWNPWIISNILLCTACAEGDTLQRNRLTVKALRILDNFIDCYAEDGGCNEGPHYWGEAAGALFDAFELLDDLTGGKADIFTHPLVYNMMDYIRKVHMTGDYFTTFADGSPEIYKDGIPNALRMGERTKNSALMTFAAQRTTALKPLYNEYGHNYRAFKNLCLQLSEHTDYTEADFDLLPDLQLAVWRKGAFCAAIKGGHNAESHNHNDVGNIIILHDGKPIFIDIGAPTYTRDLFSAKRYTIFPIASEYHNLPIAGGFTQKVGASYRADSFAADEAGASVEYASAYGEAAVQRCARSLQISEKAITLREQVDASGETVLQYYMAKQPKPSGKNTYVIEGVQIAFPAQLSCTVEAVPLTDKKIIDNWHTDTLYKFVLKSTDNAELTIKITE